MEKAKVRIRGAVSHTNACKSRMIHHSPLLEFGPYKPKDLLNDLPDDSLNDSLNDSPNDSLNDSPNDLPYKTHSGLLLIEPCGLSIKGQVRLSTFPKDLKINSYQLDLILDSFCIPCPVDLSSFQVHCPLPPLPHHAASPPQRGIPPTVDQDTSTRAPPGFCQVNLRLLSVIANLRSPRMDCNSPSACRHRYEAPSTVSVTTQRADGFCCPSYQRSQPWRQSGRVASSLPDSASCRVPS